jgi:hypothetical protein
MEPVRGVPCSGGMKRILVLAAAALALPAGAEAKGITGVTLCGPDGCKTGKLTGFGHRGPTGEVPVAPRPGTFYRLSFGDGDESAWVGHYYEPTSGLMAFKGGLPAGWMKWRRPDPAVAELAERLTREVAPFPGPVVTEVRIGKRVVRDGAASYLALYELAGERGVPGEAPGVGIRFYGATVADPWTASDLVYYPEDDVLVLGSGRYVKVPANIAADIEAARPLGAGDPIVIPWLAVAVALVGGAALVALWAGRTRGAVRGTGRSGAAPRGAAPVS